VEAAYTYQAWGGETPGHYLLAISGDKEHAEIWGWEELARRLAADGKFRDTLGEARYNLALCRFQLAQHASAAAERADLLRRAEDDLHATADSAPDKDGKSWYDKSEALLKTIRQSRK
jgi:hypothetical protein